MIGAGMVDAADRWREFKVKTGGMMHFAAYEALYEEARSASAGEFLDIGPAQGACSAAITLGRRDSGKPGMVYSIDPFVDSGSLVDKNNIEINVARVRENIERNGDPSRSTILVGKTSQVAHLITS